MRARRVLPALLLVLAVVSLGSLGLGCGKKAGSKTYPETAEGLNAMIGDLMKAVDRSDAKTAEALAGNLVLPDHAAWFKATFGDEVGARVDADYAKAVPMASKELPKAIAMFIKKGRTESSAEKLTDAGDPNANTYQDVAFKAMKTKVPLYSVRFLPPGKKTGTHLYNFVYVDGGFRFIGKLIEVDPRPEASAEMRAISELRNKDREEFFKSGKLPGDE